MAYALDNLAYPAREGSDYERAAGLHQESLILRTAQGDRQEVAISLSNLGDIALLQGDWQEAAALHSDSLERFRTLGDKVGTAYALSNLGVTALEQGEIARAHTLCRASLTLFRELRDKRHMAECLENIARVRAVVGHHEEAAKLFGAANALHTTIGAPASPRADANRKRRTADTRAALGTKAFTRAWAQGHVLTLDETVEIALRMDEADLPPENDFA